MIHSFLGKESIYLLHKQTDNNKLIVYKYHKKNNHQQKWNWRENQILQI